MYGVDVERTIERQSTLHTQKVTYFVRVLVLQGAHALQVLVVHFVELALLRLAQLRLARLEDVSQLLRTKHTNTQWLLELEYSIQVYEYGL